MNRKILLLITVIFIGNQLIAQTKVSVHGRIVESELNEPLIGAQIIAETGEGMYLRSRWFF